jgi:lipooligosaccharide transport system ATP-binding protein
VHGPPARLAEVEREAAARGLRTRRTGTSVTVLDAGDAFAGAPRPANLEDVFVLLTGESVA